ncbi:hypothetical protein VP01_2753g5 [Puccinia sorghi]|uniref:Uncharacterized protein n=1 Tax=Puccinia sorghi TaxID=27349 RepID=A0A0L6V309_9BASI|nr:hypothetical protein VP01_3734g3 [Puccinia sorghi]KNZ55151.1 hypothetical protein VP01_2753g5 [Puccinia sorghi]
MAPELFSMIGEFDFIIPSCDANFHRYEPIAHIELVNSRRTEDENESEGEVEFIAEQSFQVKIEEDDEMF